MADRTQYLPCSNLYRSNADAHPFLVYKNPNFGCGGKKGKKGISKKRKAFPFLLKKETHGRFGSYLTKCRFIRIICRVNKVFFEQGTEHR